jgi:hypothetical protein
MKNPKKTIHFHFAHPPTQPQHACAKAIPKENMKNAIEMAKRTSKIIVKSIWLELRKLELVLINGLLWKIVLW